VSGYWLDDGKLAPWERELLRHATVPRIVGGRVVWSLDDVPRATLRALCWPRRPPALACAITGAR
jgi:hypothetical protein